MPKSNADIVKETKSHKAWCECKKCVDDTDQFDTEQDYGKYLL